MPLRKTLHTFTALALILLVACEPAPPPEEEAAPPPDLSGINELRDAVASAYNANDAAAVANLYTENAIWMPGYQPTLEGKAAIQEHLQTVFDANAVKLTITPAESQVLDGWGYDRGTYILTLTPKAGGDPMEEQGRYIVILKRDPDGAWKVHRDIDNVAAALPTQ